MDKKKPNPTAAIPNSPAPQKQDGVRRPIPPGPSQPSSISSDSSMDIHRSTQYFERGSTIHKLFPKQATKKMGWMARLTQAMTSFVGGHHKKDNPVKKEVKSTGKLDMTNVGATMKLLKGVQKSAEDGEKELEPLVSTFTELVLYDENGKPYIDVNKLVYRRKSGTKKEVKEKFSWYFADYLFIVSNFISIITSAYLFAVGLQASGWDQSIESVMSVGTYYNASSTSLEDSRKKILRIWEWTPTDVGSVLLTLAVVNAINVAVGVFGCVYGFRYLLIMHVLVDFAVALVQLISAIVIVIEGTCHQQDMLGFTHSFELLIENYFKPFDNIHERSELEEIHYSSQVLNDIQISMQCCGAVNWTDYMNSRVTKLEPGLLSRRKVRTSTTNQIFPYSCCHPWWVRNIYCSSGVHDWTYPSTSVRNFKRFKERIMQTGCSPKIWLACTRLLFALGQGLIVVSIFNTLLFVFESWSVSLQIRTLDTILKEMKEARAVKLKIHHHDEADSSEDERSKKHRKSGDTSFSGFGMEEIEELKNKLALPTEDEIEFIKSRTAFAHFELRMKKTNLGKLMVAARDSVAPPEATASTTTLHDMERHRAIQPRGVFQEKLNELLKPAHLPAAALSPASRAQIKAESKKLLQKSKKKLKESKIKEAKEHIHPSHHKGHAQESMMSLAQETSPFDVPAGHRRHKKGRKGRKGSNQESMLSLQAMAPADMATLEVHPSHQYMKIHGKEHDPGKAHQTPPPQPQEGDTGKKKDKSEKRGSLKQEDKSPQGPADKTKRHSLKKEEEEGPAPSKKSKGDEDTKEKKSKK